MLDTYGYRAGLGLNTQNMMESSDGYVMSWQSADALYAAGWSIHNHNYSHQAATCANISTETLPVKTAIEARYPGYINTHFVYPYVNTTEWACIRDSGYFLSAEVYNGNNYADTLSTSPFLLNRNSMMSAGNAGTAALANALADNAASDARPRWMIMFTHDVAPGSTAPATTYDTNEAVFGAHIAYLYNTYGAGGVDNMWFAPSDEVMHYIHTRDNSVIGSVTTGACVPYISPTPTNTLIPGSTSTFTNTATATPIYTQCLMDDLEDGDGGNLYGGYWYTYVSGDPALPGETWILPEAGAASCPPTAGGALSSAYAMRVSGTVGAIVAVDNVYPCIGIGSQFSPDAGAPAYAETDISSCVGMSFYVKGDGKSYLVKISYTDSSGASLTGYDDYKYVFSAPASWTQVVIPFSSLTQAGWGTAADLSTVLSNAKEIQWQTNFNGATGSPASADLWLDNVTIYGCPVCPAAAVPTTTNTVTAAVTHTYTYTHTATATYTETYTYTPEGTATYISTPSDTITPGGPSLTFTETPTHTFSNTYTKTFTNTHTETNTSTFTYTSTFTATKTNTAVFTYTATPVATNTRTYTATHTHTGTASATNTFVNTASYTPTYTNTATPTNTVFTVFTKTPTPDIQSGLEIKDLFIYPCPVNAGEGEDIRIRFNASRAYAVLTFKFYTVSSRLVKIHEIGFGNAGVNTITIPNSVIKEFAAGAYYFVINSENNKKAAKIDKIIVMKK